MNFLNLKQKVRKLSNVIKDTKMRDKGSKGFQLVLYMVRAVICFVKGAVLDSKNLARFDLVLNTS